MTWIDVFAEGLDHCESVTISPEGYLYAGGEIDLDSKEVQTVLQGSSARALWAPNDGTFDRGGNLDVSYGGLERGQRMSTETPARWNEFGSSADTSNYPNGIAISPDGAYLYTVGSIPEPAVVRIRIGVNGLAEDRVVLHAFEHAVPDGIAVAADGSHIVSCYRPEAVYRLQPDGRIENLAVAPTGVELAAPTGVVFAGEELEQLIVANFARWHLSVIDCGIKGSPLFYPSFSVNDWKPQMRLNDQVAVVTGVTKGIGEVVARRSFGRIDTMFLNAGVVSYGNFWELSPNEFDQMMSVNVRRPWPCARAAVPLLSDGGSLIVMSSVTAFIVPPGDSVDCASKATAAQLAKGMASDLAHRGIGANALCPGAVAGAGMTQEAIDQAPEVSDSIVDGINAITPLGRMARPAEIADAAVFLASSESTFITGTSFVIDGGMIVR